MASTIPINSLAQQAAVFQGTYHTTTVRRGTFGGLSKTSPFVIAMTSLKDEGKFDRVGFGNFDLIKKYFMKSKGTRGGLPTPVAMSLLMGMHGKIMRGQTTGTQASNDLLKYLKLVHYVPCIPARKKGYFKTSKAGHDLLLLWLENDPKFKRFYEAFVAQEDIDRCTTWATMVGMGLPIPEIEEVEKKATEAMNAIIKAQANYGQLNINQSYGSLSTSIFETDKF